MPSKETVLEAFLRQSVIDDAAADEREKIAKKEQKANYEKSLKRLEEDKGECVRKACNIKVRKLDIFAEEKPYKLLNPGDRGYLDADRARNT